MVQVRLVCPRTKCNKATLREGRLPQCPECRGVWIPESALHERIATRQQTPPRLEWRREARAVVACPVCAAAMETLCLYDIPVDRCRGHGIWLDGGELDHVLDTCTRPPRPAADHGLAVDIAAEVAVTAIEIGAEAAVHAGASAHAASQMVTGHAPARVGHSSDASDADVDVPHGGAVAAASAAQIDPYGGVGGSSGPATDGAELASGVADGAGGAAEAVADGAGGIGSAIVDGAGATLGVVGEVVGTVAGGTVKVVGTIAEGLLDGLGSILDF